MLDCTKFQLGRGDELDGQLSFESRAHAALAQHGIASSRLGDAFRQLKDALDRQLEFQRADVLDLLRHLIGLSGDFGDTPAARYRLSAQIESYKRALSASLELHSFQDLTAFGAEWPQPESISDLELFVPQELLREDGGPGGHGATGCPSEQPRTASELLRMPADRWRLIHGGPGTGKTTLQHWLCRQLCQDGAQFDGVGANTVPVLLDLRRFDQWCAQLRASYRLLDFLDDEHASQQLSLRRRELDVIDHEGRLFWLIDGLDEVRNLRRRSDLVNLLANLAARPDSRGLITTRTSAVLSPHGAGGASLKRLRDAGVSVFAIQDFGLTQVRRFLDCWEAAFEEDPRISAQRQHLEETIRKSTAVRRLCQTPLCLALLAWMSRHAAWGDLRRTSILKQALDLLVIHWEARKGESRPSGGEEARPVLPGAERRLRLLRELAWYSQSESRGFIRTEELLRLVTAFLQRHEQMEREVARRAAQRLLAEFQERNHLFISAGDRGYRFAHRMFQEFLAAEHTFLEYVSEPEREGELILLFNGRWDESSWEEVLAFLASLIGDHNPCLLVHLLQAVVADVPVGWGEDFLYEVFALRCLRDAQCLEEEPLRRVALALKGLIQRGIEDGWDRNTFTSYPVLLRALREFGARWPDRQAWLNWGLNRPKKEKSGHILHPMMGRCLLIITPIEERLDVLCKVLRQEQEIPRVAKDVIEEAIAVGMEISELEVVLERLRDAPEQVRLELGLAVHRLGPSVPARQMLEELMRGAAVPEVRFTAAAALLVDEAAPAEIVLALQRDFRSVWEPRAREILQRRPAQALAHPAMQRWAEEIRLSGDKSPHAQIIRLLNNPEDHAAPGTAALTDSNPQTRLYAGIRFKEQPEGQEVLREIASGQFDDQLRIVAAEHLASISRERQHGYAALAELARDAMSQIRVRAVHNLGELSRQDLDIAPLLVDLVRSSSDPQVRLRAAAALVGVPLTTTQFVEDMDAWLAEQEERRYEVGGGSSIPAELAEVGRRELLALAYDQAGDDELRIWAAYRLVPFAGFDVDERRRAFGRLLHEAKAANVRLEAAEALARPGGHDQEAYGALAKLSEPEDPRPRFPSGIDVPRRAAADLAYLHDLYKLRRLGQVPSRRGIVRLNGVPVGTIEETKTGTRFNYDSIYRLRSDRSPLAPSLPLDRGVLSSKGLHPFFQSLLPEGEALDAAVQQFGLRADDSFGLLLVAAREQDGVTVKPAPDLAP